MSFWQENKLLGIVVGIAFLGLVFLWPSLFGLGPTVVRLDRPGYTKAELAERQLEPKIEKYFSNDPQAIPVSKALDDTVKGNQVLLANFEQMDHWMAFVSRFPFRIPAPLKGNARGRYVSAVYTYVRFGELRWSSDEYGSTINDQNDGILFAAPTRNIGTGRDLPSFGMTNMERPEEMLDPDTRIMQLALMHDLGHLAIRVGVDEITSIEPAEPYVWGLKDVDVATAYPIDVEVQCDLPTLISFLHALDGAHGRVVEAPHGEVATDPTLPVKTAAPAKEGEPRKIVVQLDGDPSISHPDPQRGDLKERFTLFRPAEDDPRKLTFVANAIVGRDLGSGKVEAAIEGQSDVSFKENGERVVQAVRPGDIASTRFFLVRGLKVKAVEAVIERNKDGFPTRVTPAHLDVQITVAALRFLELKMPKLDAKPPETKQAPIYTGL